MKKLEILVGDDLFMNATIKYSFKDIYIKKIEDGLPDYEINVQMEKTPEAVVKNASQYDVVVTDLDYDGDARGKQGYDVIDQVCKLNPKPLLILCTSSDSYEEIKQRTEGKIDYHAGPNGYHKFEDLVDIITKHYQK